MKGLVLAAGRGSRLNDLTAERNKCMCLFRGRHIIEYNFDHAAHLDGHSSHGVWIGLRVMFGVH